MAGITIPASNSFPLFGDDTGSFIKSTQEGAEDPQNQIRENSFDELALFSNHEKSNNFKL